MCLMCESYYDSCAEAKCVKRAKETDAERYKSNESQFFECEYFRSNQGLYEYFLWKGYSEPCEHIIAEHGSECNVIKPGERTWGNDAKGVAINLFGYHYCNCELIDGEWEYF